MPYIIEDDRIELRAMAESLGKIAETEGDMNYCLTVLVHSWLKAQGVRYENINAIIGVLECAKLELYRRVAAPYEDEKIVENGDIGIL